jgi:cell division protein FtsB
VSSNFNKSHISETRQVGRRFDRRLKTAIGVHFVTANWPAMAFRAKLILVRAKKKRQIKTIESLDSDSIRTERTLTPVRCAY